MLDYLKRTFFGKGINKPAPKPETFEYRVTEKKYLSGKSYFIGESTRNGDITMLTKDPYQVRREDDRRMGMLGYPPVAYTPAVIPPLLVSVKDNEYRSSIGSQSHKYTKYDDPCKVKEIICALRKEEAEKDVNRNYSKVVSEGECKCL